MPAAANLTVTPPTPPNGLVNAASQPITVQPDGPLVNAAEPAAGNALNFTDTGLAGNTTYSYRLRVRDAAGRTYLSDVLTVTTLAALTAGVLSVTGHGIGSVLLAWTAATGGAGGYTYQPQYRVVGSSTWLNFGATVTTLGSNVTGLASVTNYEFQVLVTDSSAQQVITNTVAQVTDSLVTAVLGNTLFLWHEPTLARDFTDAARTTAVTVDGNPVGGETDPSNAANHLSQGTSSRRPLFKQYTNNGKTFWSTLFDGVDDYLTHAAPANGPATNGQVFICAAGRFNSTASGRTLFHVGTEANNSAVEFIFGAGNVLNFDPYGFANICSFGALATGQYYVLTAYYDGANMVARLNGAEISRVARVLTLGSTLAQLGAVSSAAIYHSGDCPFLVSANAVPAAGDITQIEQYAAGLIGVAL